MMAFTEEDRKKMDEAADVARKNLEALVAQHPDASQALGQWWKDNFLKAGHKRLGRMIAELA
jgi:hypothetical protein